MPLAKPPYPIRADEARRPVHGVDVRSVQERRLGEFVGGQYSNYNLSSLLFEARTDKTDAVRIERWDPKAGEKPGFDVAVKQDYRSAKKGDKFGPSWTNHWLRLTINVPTAWHNKEWVELEFDPGCEALIFDTEGMTLQGITGAYDSNRRVDFPIQPKARKAELVLYIEVTCNGMFGVENSREGDPDPNCFFTLASCDLVVKNAEAWRLLWDFQLLRGLVDEMPRDGPLQNKALWVANKIQDTFRQGDPATIGECRRIAQEVLGKDWDKLEEGVYEQMNRKDKEDTVLWSLGHCHIDTAWLWPFSATQQKVARSWTTQLDLMERYPEFRFTASTAQQYVWLEKLYPKTFARLQKAVKRGTFQPIGGTWVECDGNLPSGESFCRQFLYGQRYFESRFGQRSNVFWLPDSFGYNAQLPALARGAGCDYFFTQKLSWSNVNRFPHNTMVWVGLDGTQIITHLTPVDNYDSQCGVGDLVRGVKNNKNLNVQPTALHLFGFGDGGGGPTAPELEALRRARAVYNEGYTEMPKVTVGKSAQDFFEHVTKITDNGERLPRWSGDLYLEFHRGVQTSHGSIKRWNRKLEIMMTQIEHAATLASLRHKNAYKYPKQQIDELWENILLCQFHDVLPGSSIRLVYDDAERIYKDTAKRGAKLLEEAITVAKGTRQLFTAVNALNLVRRELVEVEATALASLQNVPATQMLADGKKALVLMEDCAGNGEARPSSKQTPDAPVYVTESNGTFTLRNELVSLSVSKGHISSLRTRHSDGQWLELIQRGQRAGLTICEDYPPQFDAWETEIYSLNTATDIAFSSVRIAERGPWRCSLALEATFGKSRAVVHIALDAASAIAETQCPLAMLRFDAEVDWHEKHRFLRFEVPTVLNADLASYETPFGVTKRPTTRNTTWEAAKFEVCSHKFFDLSESGVGLSILNDCKYGASVEGGRMRLSLLKAPTYPDAHTDEGKHQMAFALLPHQGALSVATVHAARIFNAPLQPLTTRGPEHAPSMPVRLTQPAGGSVVLETIKRGEADFDYHARSGAGTSIVCRMYESLGTHVRATVHLRDLAVASVSLTNLLEDDIEGEPTTPAAEQRAHEWVDVGDVASEGLRCGVGESGETTVALAFRPFQIVTLKIVLA